MQEAGFKNGQGKLFLNHESYIYSTPLRLKEEGLKLKKNTYITSAGLFSSSSCFITRREPRMAA